MKKILVVVAMVCVGLFAGGACAQTSASSAEQAIRPLMAKAGKAAKARDASAFMASMLHSPSLVFAINGRVIHGWKALYAAQVKWWSRGKGNSRYSPSGVAPEFMALGPDVEIVTLQIVGRYMLPNGKVATSPFVVTDVWQRLPQGWRIVYSHESWAKPRPD
ncbi:MAG TPA: hypothetical protein VFW60_07230 [Rhodanobacteraceae bacterium]|nr:hypothetical protein [Rhodanobacteraceae bacterium]